MVRIFSTLLLAALVAAPVAIFAAHVPQLQSTHSLLGQTNVSGEHRSAEVASVVSRSKHKKHKKKKMNKQMKKRKHH